MKYSVLLLSAILFAGQFSFAEAPSDPPEQKLPERFQFKESFLKEFHAVFDMISAEYPALTANLEQKDAERAMTSLLRSIHSGIEPVSDKPAELTVKTSGKPAFRPMIPLSENLIFLRPESFDAETIRELERAFRKDPGGIILDLRNCGSGDFGQIASDFRSLTDRELPHLAILTGSGTEGTAEIAADLLTRNRKGIRIGEPTAGRPFPRKTVMIGKRKWLVPQPPEGADGVRFEKLYPQISEKARPIQSFENLKKSGKPDPADHTLCRAADLLKTLDLLDRKGLKK